MRHLFMVDQVKPKHKIWASQRNITDALGFEICIAAFLIIAISIVF